MLHSLLIFTILTMHCYFYSINDIKGLLLVSFEVNNSNCIHTGRYINLLLINIENDKHIFRTKNLLVFNLAISVTIVDGKDISTELYDSLAYTTNHYNAGFETETKVKFISELINKIKTDTNNNEYINGLSQSIPKVILGKYSSTNSEYDISLHSSINLIPNLEHKYRKSICGKSKITTELKYFEKSISEEGSGNTDKFKKIISIKCDNEFMGSGMVTIPIIIYKNDNIIENSTLNHSNDNEEIKEDESVIQKYFDEVWKENENLTLNNKFRVLYIEDEQRKGYSGFEVCLIVGFIAIIFMVVGVIVNDKFYNK